MNRRTIWRVPLYLILAGMLCGLSACGGETELEQQLGIDLETAQKWEESDTHGGFHGDGLRTMRFRCEGEQIEENIKEQAGWHPLPMEESEAIALFYGMETETMGYQSAFRTEAGDCFFPKAESGYYILYDRHAESQDPYEMEGILERVSMNVTAALYDAETRQLYIAELDT